MTDYEQLASLRDMVTSTYHLLMFVLTVQVLAFLLSLGKLWMMHAVRDELAAATRESAQYRTLAQQYHDLYEREGRDAQEVIRDAAKIVKETVKTGGPLSDSGTQTAVTGTRAEWDKAKERFDRNTPNPGEGCDAPG